MLISELKLRKLIRKFLIEQGPDVMVHPGETMSPMERMSQTLHPNYTPGQSGYWKDGIVDNETLCSWNDSIILDFFGIVPFAGDALDAGRAAVYIHCGKYLDAFLTIIASAPVIGAAVVAVKTVRKIKKVEELSSFLSDVAKKLNMKMSTLIEYIKESIKDLNAWLKKVWDEMFKTQKLAPEDQNYLKTWETWVENTAKNISEMPENYYTSYDIMDASLDPDIKKLLPATKAAVEMAWGTATRAKRNLFWGKSTVSSKLISVLEITTAPIYLPMGNLLDIFRAISLLATKIKNSISKAISSNPKLLTGEEKLFVFKELESYDEVVEIISEGIFDAAEYLKSDTFADRLTNLLGPEVTIKETKQLIATTLNKIEKSSDVKVFAKKDREYGSFYAKTNEVRINIFDYLDSKISADHVKDTVVHEFVHLFDDNIADVILELPNSSPIKKKIKGWDKGAHAFGITGVLAKDLSVAIRKSLGDITDNPIAMKYFNDMHGQKISDSIASMSKGDLLLSYKTTNREVAFDKAMNQNIKGMINYWLTPTEMSAFMNSARRWLTSNGHDLKDLKKYIAHANDLIKNSKDVEKLPDKVVYPGVLFDADSVSDEVIEIFSRVL